MRRIIARIVVALVLLIVAVGAGAYVYLRQSLPDYDAEATVAGLSGPVDIVRDADAIPHIFASTKRDGLFGLGYVHAQDRLWQMEFQRRSAMAGCPKSSAPPPSRRIASCARSASAAPREARGTICRPMRGSRSTRTSPA